MRTRVNVVLLGAVVMLAACALFAFAQPKGQEVTIQGELVDLWCYMASGARGAEHKACAVACAKAGNPIGIVDAEGNVYLCMGGKDKDPAREMLIEKMADTVTVTGIVVKKGGMQAVFISSLK